MYLPPGNTHSVHCLQEDTRIEAVSTNTERLYKYIFTNLTSCNGSNGVDSSGNVLYSAMVHNESKDEWLKE